MFEKRSKQEHSEELLTARDNVSRILKKILEDKHPIGTKFKSYLVSTEDLPECLEWTWIITDYITDDWYYYCDDSLWITNMLNACTVVYKAVDSIGRPNGKELYAKVSQFNDMYEVK